MEGLWEDRRGSGYFVMASRSVASLPVDEISILSPWGLSLRHVRVMSGSSSFLSKVMAKETLGRYRWFLFRDSGNRAVAMVRVFGQPSLLCFLYNVVTSQVAENSVA